MLFDLYPTCVFMFGGWMSVGEEEISLASTNSVGEQSQVAWLKLASSTASHPKQHKVVQVVLASLPSCRRNSKANILGVVTPWLR